MILVSCSDIKNIRCFHGFLFHGFQLHQPDKVYALDEACHCELPQC